MTLHKMNLSEPHFTNVVSGAKIYEIRIHDSKRRKIFLDDYIVFTNSDNSQQISCKVVEIILDDSFKTIIEFCKLENVLPNIDSLEEAVKLYENIQHQELADKGIATYKDAARHFGIVAFKLERV